MGAQFLQETAKQLIEQEPWHAWVLSYGISHGRRMEIGLHHGVPRATGRIVCGWVSYFSGPLEGGPYRLKATEQPSAVESTIRIESDDGKFVLLCNEIKVGGLLYAVDGAERAASPELRLRILSNRFVDKLRMQMIVDEESYRQLCDDLRALAGEWRAQGNVEKELVQHLYVLPTITRNIARAFPERPDLATKLDEMATELDALVLDCLADGGAR